MIEKHFCMPGDDVSVDSGFSMELNQLANYKKSLRNVHSAIGEPTLELPDIAKPSLSGRRSLYVVADICKGEAITNENVRSIRPSYGMEPKYLKEIIGKVVVRDVRRGERMTWELISNE